MTRAPSRSDNWRWRCELCAGFAYSDSGVAAVADFYRHYSAKHQQGDQ